MQKKLTVGFNQPKEAWEVYYDYKYKKHMLELRYAGYFLVIVLGCLAASLFFLYL